MHLSHRLRPSVLEMFSARIAIHQSQLQFGARIRETAAEREAHWYRKRANLSCHEGNAKGSESSCENKSQGGCVRLTLRPNLLRALARTFPYLHARYCDQQGIRLRCRVFLSSQLRYLTQRLSVGSFLFSHSTASLSNFTNVLAIFGRPIACV